LSIAFELNVLNVKGTFESIAKSATVSPGQRGPDVQLQKPGTNEATRLHKETPNNARFHVVVFAGEPDRTSGLLGAFAQCLEASKIFMNARLPISWLTIPAKSGPSAFELLGIMPFGRVFYDEKQTAHARYGIDIRLGGVVVLRPDGWVGTVATLKVSAVAELELYFSRVLLIGS
jgi:phenol 2-monooxygenase